MNIFPSRFLTQINMKDWFISNSTEIIKLFNLPYCKNCKFSVKPQENASDSLTKIGLIWLCTLPCCRPPLSLFSPSGLFIFVPGRRSARILNVSKGPNSQKYYNSTNKNQGSPFPRTMHVWADNSFSSSSKVFLCIAYALREVFEGDCADMCAHTLRGCLT